MVATIAETKSSMDLPRHASPLIQEIGNSTASPLASSLAPAKLESSEHPHHDSRHHHHQQYSNHSNHNHQSSSSTQILKRVDTQDLKSKLAAVLGNNGKRYWSALLDFMTAKIDRIEFEQEATLSLKPQHVHLHNSLVLGLLYNASVDVPGPSSPRVGHGHLKRGANGTLVGLDGEGIGSLSDGEEEDEPLHRMLAPPDKRLRLLTAGLSRKDRARIKNVPKTMSHSRSLASGATSSLGWAGAGADMLEKKRKEEERRRTIDEKKRVKEIYTEIGAKDWKSNLLQGSGQIASVHERLSLPIQQEIARAQAAPLCVESKQLPDLESMRDVMTLHAVEAGLPRGAQPQAAALLLAALQNHLQNLTSSIITKVRANRQMGIRTTHLLRSASDDYQLSPIAPNTQMQPVDEQDSFDSSIRPSPVSKSTRMLTSDLPMSLTSSSASLDYAGTSASASLADSSMISLLSTAPTSIPPDSTSSEEVGQGEGARKSIERDEEEEGEEEQDQMDSFTSSDQRREISVAGDSRSLELRHLSFLLNVAPHTVVEPLGLGTQERLLAPDWTAADEDAIRDQEWTNEGMLLRESILAATSKMSSIPSSTPQQRSNYIIDQLAPVRLFDRKTLVETQALHNNSGNRSTKGGLSLPNSTTANAASTKAQALEGEGDENKNIILSTFPTRNYTGGHHHHRGLDPHLYDVVDPVALLGSLVN